MRKFAAIALGLGVAIAPGAVAESELYVTGGLSSFDADDVDLQAVTLRGGVEFHDLLGAEFEAAFGLGAEQIDGAGGAEAELENQFAGYLVARYPVIPNLDVLGRVGYTTGELQTANNGVSSDADLDGFAFGLGGEYMFTEQLGIRGDYTRVEVDDDALDGGVNMFSIAGVYKFGHVR
ncbi:MAG: porin family protein [Henriciella sp.]